MVIAMNLIDCHTHSTNSPDGISPLEDMVRTAAEKGLAAYAVTDHCEVNRWFSIEHYGAEPNEYDTYDFGRDFEISMRENTRLKAEYEGTLNMICGIELGQAPCDFGLAESIVADNRLDFVIGSIHQISGQDDYAFIDYSKINVTELLSNYYKDVLSLCKWNKFDILGHLTYPLRYITGEHGIEVDMSAHEEMIREIFRTIINNGKGIEINTSGLRQPYGKALPDLRWVKLYRELGGEILSLGSDAHCTADLGKNLADGAEIALEAGFNQLCYFKERNPHFIDIK